MQRTTGPGSPPITVRSWPFGTPSRRRLLEVILLTSSPGSGWRKSGLERACQVGVGSLDAHLAALVSLGLLIFEDERFVTPKPLPPLARSLRLVLRQTATAPDHPAPPLPRRKYSQH